MKADFHMHTSFSSDSDTTPEDMVRGAIEKGLQTICITDHYDKDFPMTPGGEEFAFDMESYVKEIRRLKELYKDSIDIRMGIEIGLQPHLGDFYHVLINAYPFDFVIGSVHVIDHLDPYYGEYFIGKEDEDAYRQAFEETLENIKVNKDFDVLGHIDYVVRYGKQKAEHYSYQKYADILDEIMKELIRQGKGLELNAAGWKYGLGFCHPHPDVLKRYRELGGEIITVGADGHKPEHIAYDFSKVSAVLKECGFQYYTEFKERKAYFKHLP